MTFWQNKKVVVTGGAGFVGIHLVLQLLQHGAQVSVLDDFSRGKSNIIKDLMYHIGDATQEQVCQNAFKGQDVVFNLAAAVAGVDYNQSHNAEMFERNVLLQAVPVRVAIECGVAHYLQTSSVCVYAPEHNNPCMEHNGLTGQPTLSNAGYAMAKRMGEYLVEWHAGKIHAVIVRPSNIYGPRDYFVDKPHVIPALIHKCLFDDEIVVNGDGKAVREFIYVEDVAAGMLVAVEFGESGEAYNLGTDGDTKISIADLIVMLQKHTGTLDKQVVYKNMFDGGDSVRWSDTSKANAMLGWAHDVGLEEGLENTVKWYKHGLQNVFSGF